MVKEPDNYEPDFDEYTESMQSSRPNIAKPKAAAKPAAKAEDDDSDLSVDFTESQSKNLASVSDPALDAFYAKKAQEMN